MKREFFIHFSFWFSFFVFLTIVKGLFNFSYWEFWLGGVLGLILPDIDHLVYVFFLQPQELTSQRITFLLNKHEIKRTLELLYETRSERKSLIFHTILLQLIFLVLTFWITTSSISLFGKGLVLSFSIHLLADQAMDINDLKNFDNWTGNLPIKINFQKSQIYLLSIAVIVFVLGLLV